MKQICHLPYMSFLILRSEIIVEKWGYYDEISLCDSVGGR